MVFNSHIITKEDISIEDSGQAKILTINTTDDKIFFRLQSWDEDGKNHESFDEIVNQYVGKRIRIEFDDADANYL